ncbi:hypothetical protein BH24CHL7_BH24CHL7_06680 [soil metagenome]|jgi:hypothetical protein
MGDLYQFDGERRARLQATVESQLADLNAKATVTLRRGMAAPAGLPPAGSWIRAITVDDDARATPRTPWHSVVGWDIPLGCLSTRCRRRSGTAVSIGTSDYVGGGPNARRQYSLEVLPDRPSEGSCRQCDKGHERDAEAVKHEAAEARLAVLLAVLPDIEAIATDPALKDAERGRRLRSVWPA